MITTRRHPWFWMTVLAVLTATAAGANWYFHYHSAAPPQQPDSASTHARTDENQPIVCFGHVDVEQGVRSLYPLQPGRVAEVPVKETDFVRANTVLLRLDDHLAALLVKEAQADLGAAKAQLSQARTGPAQHRSRVAQQKEAIEATRQRLSAARHGLERKQSLLKIQQLSGEEVSAALDLVKELEAALRAEQEKLRELELFDPQVPIVRAEAEIAVKEARLAQAQRGLDECALRAPEDGDILRILVGAGDVLGNQPRQPAILFCPKRPRFIRAEVAQEFAGRLQVGQPAFIQDDTRVSDTWKGQVLRISDWYSQRRSIIQEPLQVNDIRTLECIIQVDQGHKPLRIGQRMRVTIGGTPPGE